ncbi:hypothetical protein BRAO285_360087 [Bradyrhizobium sp. ORS 285]|nr:hypothetical protein BRAO285_360087 [Bradyrhizobium sp. ORS 285]
MRLNILLNRAGYPLERGIMVPSLQRKDTQQVECRRMPCIDRKRQMATAFGVRMAPIRDLAQSRLV